jgi:hypothetical protein
MLLIYFLIVFFISLFIYQIILAFCPSSIIEGMTTSAPNDKDKDKDKNKSYGTMYEEYPTDPLILGKLNAGNIEYLKSQIETLSTNNVDIDQMQTTVDQLQQQVSDLSTQINQLGQSMISSEAPDNSSIAGYTEDTSYDTINTNSDSTSNDNTINNT